MNVKEINVVIFIIFFSSNCDRSLYLLKIPLEYISNAKRINFKTVLYLESQPTNCTAVEVFGFTLRRKYSLSS